MKNYYKILEVDRNSSKDDIKLAFRKLAKQYHPDSNIGNNNFTEIMQDINDAYSILRDETKRAEYNKKYDSTFGKSQYKREEPKKEKTKEEPKREKAKQKTEQPKQEQRNLDQYIWDGSNPQKYKVFENSFEKFKNRVISDLKKDEFETTAEFNLRKKIVESELLNNYFGSQEVEMVYNADNLRFEVSINESLKFLIAIPKNIARDFKNSVKRFRIILSKDLKILEISTNFRGVKYMGVGFNRNQRIEKEFVDTNPEKNNFGLLFLLILVGGGIFGVVKYSEYIENERLIRIEKKELSNINKERLAEIQAKQMEKERLAEIKAKRKQYSRQEAQSLFAKCAGCHGANAEKSALGKSQVIAGWGFSKIEDAIYGYKDGTYGGAMKGLMKGQVFYLSDYDIRLLAEYISNK